MSIWITADMLTIGDKIIEADGKRSIAVKKLDPCSTKGVRKVHVNGSLCYDTLSKIEVIPAHRPMLSDSQMLADLAFLAEGN
jgi:hypothetical protein